MSRFAKFYLFTLVATIACTALAVGFGSMAESVSPGLAKDIVIKMTGRNAGETVEIDESFEIAEDFEEIDIDSEAGGVEIVSVEDGKKPRLRFVGTAPKSEQPPFGFKVSRRELKIETKHTGWFGFVIDDGDVTAGGGSDIRTILELPKSWKGSVDVETIGGDIRVGFFRFDELELKTVSGDVETDWSLGAQKLSAETVSGDLKLFGHFRDVDVGSVSGDVSLGLPADGRWRFDLETVSGDLQNTMTSTGDDKAGHVTIETVSGDVIIAPMNERGESM